VAGNEPTKSTNKPYSVVNNIYYGRNPISGSVLIWPLRFIKPSPAIFSALNQLVTKISYLKLTHGMHAASIKQSAFSSIFCFQRINICRDNCLQTPETKQKWRWHESVWGQFVCLLISFLMTLLLVTSYWLTPLQPRDFSGKMS